ncbi:hypothetical protein COU37_04240 [Candidatus Micrarchaeota archaeon CG10_big_fil_rev_8_21_14_0_10_45_29]|nr:MAG: hypothetical protein COU37_04240 [Candidatus Micrarchaeota archaeon CG10_big_fil_rev_8_21_14_0_10_45_29]
MKFFNAKKGFVFTVLALILISFIFISVQLWAQGQQVEEGRSAQKFKLDAMRSSLAMISDESFGKFANVSMIFAIDTLAKKLEEHPNPDVRGIMKSSKNNYVDNTYYVNATMYELMFYGSTGGYLANEGNSLAYGKNVFYGGECGGLSGNLTYTDYERKYLVSNYFEQTTRAAKMLGYNATWGTPENFSFNQTDAWTIHLFMQVPVTFQDADGTIKISKVVNANISMDISGMSDPYLMRQDILHRPDACESVAAYGGNACLINKNCRHHKHVYHSDVFDNYLNAQAKEYDSEALEANEGIGWFFGPVTTSTKAAFSETNYRLNISKIDQYIFATTSADLAREQSAYFGGIILYSQPENTRTTRTVYDDTYAPSCYIDAIDQIGCLYCTRTYEARGPNCAGVSVPNTIEYYNMPAKKDIPYVSLRGGLPDVPLNYHLNLPQMLIHNQIENISDICDPDGSFNPCIGNKNNINDVNRLNKKNAGSMAKSSIWDLTGPRDLAICGFYVKSPFGPSYLQRFTALSDYPPGISTKYSQLGQGIESFNSGTWAGGMNDESREQFEASSRIDYQFYSGESTPSCSGYFEKGMPGCKTLEVCSNQTLARDYGPGRFALTNKTDENPSQRYNIDALTYEPQVMWGDNCR